MLVDDHEIVRQGLKLILAREGDSAWEICGEAENGLEAVEKVGELKPDLVILDVSMPIMNGFEAARQIRVLAPATKIVMLSMHDSPQAAQQAKQAGADAYVVKSHSSRELHQLIAAMLAGK